MKLLTITTLLLVLNINLLYAKNEKVIVKHKINCDMTVKYKKLPPTTNKFSEIFTKGMFYGRLRVNNFGYEKENLSNITNMTIDNYITGLGGSFVYKTAKINGFSFTNGLYGAKTVGHVQSTITTFGQNYLQYEENKNHLKLGRFPLETFLLKSNDTKMIPNTFEGGYLEILSLPKTELKAAYITKQKLRDHENFHHPFAYGDNQTTPHSQWSQNDDGGMHRGLTLSKLQQNHIKDNIIVLEAKNGTLPHTFFRIGYTTVPNLISSSVIEGTYKLKLDKGFIIMPSLRYMQQFDNGAGAIGGANLRNNTIGYSNPNSLASSLIASRLDIIKDESSIRFGYSKVDDKGDIVAPWRGLPTAGYTRAMSQTNWYANTQTYMLRADYDFEKARMVEGLRGMMRYAIQDFDDKKPGVQADSKVLTIDFIKHYSSMPNFYTKIRTAFVKGENQTENFDGTLKADPSYHEVRLEVNYLF